MKKRLTFLYAVIACACMLLLSACGSAQQQKTNTSDVEETVTKGAAADSAGSEFLGTWVLAVAKTEGLTITGDFSLFFKDGETIALDVKEDGTATVSFGKADIDFTWEEGDEGTIKLVSSGEVDDAERDAKGVLGAYDTMSLAHQEDSLVLSLIDDSGEASMDFIFTSDGTLKGYEALTGENAADVTSAEDLVGEWTLSGLTMSTMTIYGSAEDLSDLVGTSADTSMTIREDGSGTAMGSDFAWEADGTSVVFDYDGLTATVKNLDGDLIVDMTSMLGGEVPTVYRFTR